MGSVAESTWSHVVGADALSPGEGVEGSGLPRSRRAAETLGAVGRVHPARGPHLQGAGLAAATARLPQDLPAVQGNGRALVQLLMGTGGTSDGLRSHHRG